MDTYHLAVCEDDSIVREGIHRFCGETLTEENICHEIKEFSSAEELAEVLETEPESFDLLILDIMMGEKNGMEFAKEVRRWDEKTSIIFVTGCEEYIEMGYDVQAAQFLIKPIVWDKLRTAILRDCRKRYGQKNMVLQKGRKLLKLPLEDVLYAEADGKHGVRIVFAGGMESFPVSLAQLEEQTEEKQFIRCHNSYLVNLRHIRRLNNQNLILDNGQELPISRTYLKQCQEMLIACINR